MRKETKAFLSDRRWWIFSLIYNIFVCSANSGAELTYRMQQFFIDPRSEYKSIVSFNKSVFRKWNKRIEHQVAYYSVSLNLLIGNQRFKWRKVSITVESIKYQWSAINSQIVMRKLLVCLLVIKYVNCEIKNLHLCVSVNGECIRCFESRVQFRCSKIHFLSLLFVFAKKRSIRAIIWINLHDHYRTSFHSRSRYKQSDHLINFN